MKKVLLIIGAIIIALCIIFSILAYTVFGLTISDVFSQKLPKSDNIEIQYSDTYFVTKHSYFEKQEKSQCGGYSSAYVLRCLGEDITGKSCYDQLGYKFSNGYVLPQALTEMFAQYDYAATIYRGDLDSLKTRLRQGNPLIVLVGKSYHWQHYITVVGYDKDNVYIYDSNNDIDNSKGYNRALSYADFMAIWENGIPFFAKIYFVLSNPTS